MNTNQPSLAELLTGNDQTDVLIQAAYDLGIRKGRVSDRGNLLRDGEITATRRCLEAVIRTMKIDLNEALAMFQIPKKERSIYTEYFAARARQKAGSK